MKEAIMANRAVVQDTICALRHQIAKIEGTLPERLDSPEQANAHALVSRQGGRPVATSFATGAARFDELLGGGLPTAGLVEIHGAASREAGAVAGFALALAGIATEHKGLLIWIGTSEIFREAGRPYAPGLAELFGILPKNLLLAEAEKLTDVLWIAEEAANLGSPAVILLESRGSSPQLDLTATRRLHRRALTARHSLFLLRQAGNAEPTAAPLRLVVAPVAAGPRLMLSGPLYGSIGPPAFQVSIDKSRKSPPATFTLEWNGDRRAFKERDHDHATKNTVALAAAPADGARPSPALREIVAFPHAASDATSGDQPPREQHAAHRRARRAG